MNQKEIKKSLNIIFAKNIYKPFMKAIKEYRLIASGDKVACCISGGKDSMLLALLLQEAQKLIDFELMFLAMDPGYEPQIREKIEQNAKLLGLDITFFDTNVLRVAENHAAEHPCFLCAKMRRGYLYAKAQEHGYNKIALGHHYDDMIETVLMGLLYGGQVQTMLPRLKSKNYADMELIRPLCFVREKDIFLWQQTCNLTFFSCNCPAKKFENGTKRTEIKNLIAALTKKNPQVEKNIFNAIKNVDITKILGWRDKEGIHSFIDEF